jgi:hypothetical protein
VGVAIAFSGVGLTRCWLGLGLGGHVPHSRCIRSEIT